MVFYTIRVSATANEVAHQEHYEVPEDDILDRNEALNKAYTLKEGLRNIYES